MTPLLAPLCAARGIARHPRCLANPGPPWLGRPLAPLAISPSFPFDSATLSASLFFFVFFKSPRAFSLTARELAKVTQVGLQGSEAAGAEGRSGFPRDSGPWIPPSLVVCPCVASARSKSWAWGAERLGRREIGAPRDWGAERALQPGLHHHVTDDMVHGLSARDIPPHPFPGSRRAQLVRRRHACRRAVSSLSR